MNFGYKFLHFCNKTSVGTITDRSKGDRTPLFLYIEKNLLPQYLRFRRHKVVYFPFLCLDEHKSRKQGPRSKLTRVARKDKISWQASSSSIAVIENLPDLWHLILCLQRIKEKDLKSPLPSKSIHSTQSWMEKTIRRQKIRTCKQME